MYKVKNGTIMGLAASQARLLTITSRMSNNELRQQRIAMDKMRLASDSDKVANEYSEALNNQLLKFNNKSFTISDLEAAGYSVMKTSSGITSSSGVYSGAAVAKPTCPRPEEIPKPTFSKTNSSSGDIISNNKVYSSLPNYVARQGINNAADYFSAATDLVRLTYVSKSGSVSDGSDDYDADATINKRLELWNNVSVPMIENIAEYVPQQVRQMLYHSIDEITTKFNNLQNDKTSSSDARLDEIFNSISTLRNNIYYSNVHDLLSSQEYSENGGVVKDYRDNGSRVPTNKSTTALQEEQNALKEEQNAQQAEYAQWQKDVQEATTAWNNYDAYINARDKATGATDEQKELYNQLKQSPEFLNKGLLSGYLTLVNSSGEMVSTTSVTNFTTEYDKSDDAAAEAKYNSETAKINRKEKLLDQQAKQLETEYNALNTELESIKSIISDHASKDFSTFS